MEFSKVVGHEAPVADSCDGTQVAEEAAFLDDACGVWDGSVIWQL